MWTSETVNFVCAPDKDKKMGDKMLNLLNEIDELRKETRVYRKLMKAKIKNLRSLKKQYPRVILWTDEVEYDDFFDVY
jgi:hypothetical protein